MSTLHRCDAWEAIEMERRLGIGRGEPEPWARHLMRCRAHGAYPPVPLTPHEVWALGRQACPQRTYHEELTRWLTLARALYSAMMGGC